MTDVAIEIENIQDPEVDKKLLLDVVRLQDEDIYQKRLKLNKRICVISRLIVIVLQGLLTWGLYSFSQKFMSNVSWLSMSLFLMWCVFLHVFLEFKSEAKYTLSLYILRKFPNKEAFMKNFSIQFMLNEGLYDKQNIAGSYNAGSMRDYQKNKELDNALKVFNEHLDDFYASEFIRNEGVKKIGDVLRLNKGVNVAVVNKIEEYVKSVVKRVDERKEKEKDDASQILINNLKGSLTKQDILTYWKD